MGKRDIAGGIRPGGQRNADQIGGHLIKAGGFGVDGDGTRGMGPRDPSGKRVGIAQDLIAAAVDGRHGRRIAAHRIGPARVGIDDGGGGHAKPIGDPFGQAAEFHLSKEIEQHLRLGFAHLKFVERDIDGGLRVQRHQPFRQADLVGESDQRLAALGLGNFTCPFKKRLQTPEFIYKKCGGLDPDAGRAGNVVDTVTGQRLHIDHALGAHAELGLDPLAVDAQILHRIEHLDAAADKLHQILVGTDDGAAPPRLAGLAGERGDDVVGLVILQLQARDVEGARRLARQRDLGAQILGHGLAVGLVEVIHIVAERVAALVKHHGGMGGRIWAGIGLDHAVDHVAKARHRADGQTIGFARERRQRMIGAEDKGRAIDEMQVMSLAESHACHSPVAMC